MKMVRRFDVYRDHPSLPSHHPVGGRLPSLVSATLGRTGRQFFDKLQFSVARTFCLCFQAIYGLQLNTGAKRIVEYTERRVYSKNPLETKQNPSSVKMCKKYSVSPFSMNLWVRLQFLL